MNIVTDHCYTEPRRPTVGGPLMDVYDSSKWALNGLTLAWARALEGKVRVNGLVHGRHRLEHAPDLDRATTSRPS